ncbi:stage V sporulation protein AA [Tissierella sp. Yu-01]|uniref:stage V sporulation protein AA n=1 Tax=Tissierella sp. Yu-01 TaxID=3035694 RepID=UPI00240DEB4E|nr:stage V sporulation protein AA [Tissierella sp. Yu-01]WFA09601.1 stage V sporulation protein AA [Tissierella sp. Yu-01]
MNKEKVYVVLKEKATLDIKDSIYVKDIGNVYCLNEEIRKTIEDTEVYSSKGIETWDLINTVDIVNKVLENSDVDIKFYGASDILLEIKSQEKQNKLLELLKILFVSFSLFFGAALGIMYFHEDVNMSETMKKLYFSFTGIEKDNPLLMVIPYSIGLGIGMLTFFSRVISTSKRRRMEPGPMDIELYLYDKDMEDYIMNELSKHK